MGYLLVSILRLMSNCLRLSKELGFLTPLFLPPLSAQSWDLLNQRARAFVHGGVDSLCEPRSGLAAGGA